MLLFAMGIILAGQPINSLPFGFREMTVESIRRRNISETH
jgi:hypothetical protein